MITRHHTPRPHCNIEFGAVRPHTRSKGVINVNLQWTPMRWPPGWKNPEALSLLKESVFNCLLLEAGADLGPVAEQAKRNGLAVVSTQPMGVRVAKGEWPGIQMAARGGGGVSAGPTGVPWINSNGWKARLEATLHPGDEVWIDAPPKGARIFPESLAAAYLDTAACGGRWIVTLDDATAGAVAAQEARALAGWKRLTTAAAFFDARKDWAGYAPEAVVGVVSSFGGDDEFLSGETLNLLARANQQYRIVVKSGASEESWKGLRAILYVDGDAPAPALRRQIEAQVQGGKMLIAGPGWGKVAGPLAKDQEHPRYEIRTMGRGKIAIAADAPTDPYELANDSVLLVSHRYELLRFYNAGAEIAYLGAAADRQHALLHLLLYANRGPDDATVWIARRYRGATLRTTEKPEGQRLETTPVREGTELHFPPLAQYAAVELEV